MYKKPVLIGLLIVCFSNLLIIKALSQTPNQAPSIKEVKINRQIWSTENYNSGTFRNGDAIPQAKTKEEWVSAWKNKSPVWCYYNFDSKNEKKFGKLYNWYCISDSRGIAPEGWHVPSDDEWVELTDFVGIPPGLSLKAKQGWEYSENGKKYFGNGEDKFGFNAKSCGVVSFDGVFCCSGYKGIWWTSTPQEDMAFFRRLDYEQDGITRWMELKGAGCSLRFVRDY
jgi:uncharacterized protein (TIGR02145 family)